MTIRPRSESTPLNADFLAYTQIGTILSEKSITKEVIEKAQQVFDQATTTNVWKSSDLLLGKLGCSYRTWEYSVGDYKTRSQKMIQEASANLKRPASTLTFEKIEVQKLPTSAAASV